MRNISITGGASVVTEDFGSSESGTVRFAVNENLSGQAVVQIALSSFRLAGRNYDAETVFGNPQTVETYFTFPRIGGGFVYRSVPGQFLLPNSATQRIFISPSFVDWENSYVSYSGFTPSDFPRYFAVFAKFGTSNG